MRDDDYPLASSPDEIKRLRVQAESLSDEAAILLDRMGVEPGMACLDLGCGAGGIVDLLSAKVGPSGSVLGLDVENYSLAAARAWADDLGLGNVRFRSGDIFSNDLPDESFDLVHMRYVITTVGRHKDAVAAASRLVRKGGLLAIEEADASGIRCYPENPAFSRLTEALKSVFVEIDADPYAGQHLYRLLREAGLQDVDFRCCTARARAHDDLVEYLPQTVLSVREAMLKFGLMDGDEIDADIAACRDHLADPNTISTTSVVFQAWGRKPQ